MADLDKRIETIHDEVEAVYDSVNAALELGELSSDCLSSLKACATWLSIARVNLGFAADAAERAFGETRTHRQAEEADYSGCDQWRGPRLQREGI